MSRARPLCVDVLQVTVGVPVTCTYTGFGADGAPSDVRTDGGEVGPGAPGEVAASLSRCPGSPHTGDPLPGQSRLLGPAGSGGGGRTGGGFLPVTAG